MDATSKKIAVIGAGPVGLVALKSLLEKGHEVTAYEQQSGIGGLWNYQEDSSNEGYASLPNDPRKYVSACYYSLIQNTSKLMTQFSDFPASDSMPDVLQHYEYLRYLQDYTKHFRLHDHIKLNSTVIDLHQVPASARDVRGWEVHYETSDGRSAMEIYDLVVVASGKFTRPSMPVYPGMVTFNNDNTVLHSVQIRRDDIFKNKRVLIAGGGVSGTEMVCNALNGNAKIYWTVTGSAKNTDHNHWAYSRCLETDDKPWDHSITRCGQPQEVFGEKGKLFTWLYPLNQCKSHPYPRLPGDGFAITDVPRIKNAIHSGKVHLISSINHFSETSVVLSDGTVLDDIDLVVFCTGYTKAFPFLDRLWDKKKQANAMLYRHMLPVEEQLQGIAFVGMTLGLPSIFPVAEMQSRWLAEFWACRSNTTDGPLYSKEELSRFEAEIHKRKESLAHREKFDFLLDSFGYIEKLAVELGCRPPVEEWLQDDKELATALMYAPFVSTQYRLVGGNAWPQAREYIIKIANQQCSKNNDI